MKIYDDPVRNLEVYMTDSETYLIGLVRGEKRTLAETSYVSLDKKQQFIILSRLFEKRWLEIKPVWHIYENIKGCKECGKKSKAMCPECKIKHIHYLDYRRIILIHKKSVDLRKNNKSKMLKFN